MWWRTPWLRQRRTLAVLAGWDAAVLTFSYNVLFALRIGRWPGVTKSVLALLILWVGASYLLGRYSSQDFSGLRVWRLLRAPTVGLIVLVVVVVLLNWGFQSGDPRTFRGFLLPMLASTTLLSAAAEWAATRTPSRKNRWLIVGNASEIKLLRKEIKMLGLAQYLELHYCSSRVFALNQTVQAGGFDGLAVSETADLDDELLQNLLSSRGRGASVCTLVAWAERHLQRVPPELFSSRTLLHAEGFELQPGRWGWRVKRLGDVVVASTLLVLTLPLLLVACGLIRLEDGGPAFYSQIRTGLYGAPIRIWKLRSMRHGAELQGVQWAKRNDPRITGVGRWLRRLRIDELPQLVSVLKGEMSLIGPRPERPELEDALQEAIVHYSIRHWVKPGLSGWAQVCYPYGASIEDSRIKLGYDLYYIRNAGPLLDLLVLIKTLRLVAGARGSEPHASQLEQ
ncbi:MAG: exopolysaccharide biosynthesis polyprenyl glycosylphosphotransferase [Cyanobium sp.]